MSSSDGKFLVKKAIEVEELAMLFAIVKLYIFIEHCCEGSGRITENIKSL